MNGDLFIIDAGPLGIASNPRESEETAACRAWIRGELAQGSAVMVPDVVVYEVRRELVRAKKARGLARLAEVLTEMERIPIAEAVWDRAAGLWAEARLEGKPTAKHEALDADLLIAACAQLAGEDGWNVAVVTGNPGHLARFCRAVDWHTLAVPPPAPPPRIEP